MCPRRGKGQPIFMPKGFPGLNVAIIPTGLKAAVIGHKAQNAKRFQATFNIGSLDDDKNLFPHAIGIAAFTEG